MSETWTTRRLLQWTADHLSKKGVDSPRLSAEMMLAHVLGTERLKLYMDPHRPASDLERATFRKLVAKAGEHEPVDYLVGHAPFMTMQLKVTRDTLIPRPSTEALVEHVIQHARRTPGFSAPTVADVGTGSGAIAIAIAKHLPGSHVIATDLSPEALDVARGNAAKQGVADRIEFRQGDLLAPLSPGDRLTYLVSNPPYISDDEWAEVQPNVRDYEPESALRGGADGLRYLRPLIEHGADLLQRPGQVVLEIAASQEQAVLGLAESVGRWSHAHVLPDHETLPRVLIANAR